MDLDAVGTRIERLEKDQRELEAVVSKLLQIVIAASQGPMDDEWRDYTVIRPIMELSATLEEQNRLRAWRA